MKTSLLIVFLCVLTACATAPKLNLQNIDKTVMPQNVVDDVEVHKSKKILWGGAIVRSQNLSQNTLIEILAYPLSSNLKPKIKAKPMRRFLAEFPGYLETVDFSPGRLITITGTVNGLQSGSIGEASYIYPFVKIDEKHLWSIESAESESNVHFGFGIMISN